MTVRALLARSWAVKDVLCAGLGLILLCAGLWVLLGVGVALVAAGAALIFAGSYVL